MNIDRIDKNEDLLKEFETLYVNGKYKDIIQLRLMNSELDYSTLSQDEYCQLIEIFSGSYIQLDLLNEALVLIDKHITFLKNKKNLEIETMEDITTFFHFKVIIKQKRKSLFDEFRTIKEYIALGGIDINLLSLKNDVENLIYERYIITNKIILGITMIMTFLIISFPKIFNNTYTSIGTSIAMVWIVTNYVFYRRIHVLFMKALNFLFLAPLDIK